MPRVAIIIPAYNEESRIAAVISAAIDASYGSEVIVVNDGSLDRTLNVARSFSGVTVVDLPFNIGKGGAMAAGVRSTSAEYVAFIDADLSGLRSEHIDSIIGPILTRECDMCVGVFRGGKLGSNTAMRVAPFLSGQRAMHRELFESIPYVSELRFGIELALTNAAKRLKKTVHRVVLRGVSNCLKEEKLGLVNGLAARTRMYKEITEAMVRSHKRRIHPPRWPKI